MRVWIDNKYSYGNQRCTYKNHLFTQQKAAPIQTPKISIRPGTSLSLGQNLDITTPGTSVTLSSSLPPVPVGVRVGGNALEHHCCHPVNQRSVYRIAVSSDPATVRDTAVDVARLRQEKDERAGQIVIPMWTTRGKSTTGDSDSEITTALT